MGAMFFEWCEEMAKYGKNVLNEFELLIKWQGYKTAEWPDIEARAQYIIIKYGR